MKRFLGLAIKAFAVAAVLGVIAVVSAPFLLKRYLPPEKVRSMIVTEAAKRLGREVRLGEVSLDLVHGVAVKGLAVSERPDFKAGTFAEVRSFGVTVRWGALLRGQVVANSVSADGLKLSVVKRKDGLYNFSDIAGSTAPAGGGAGGAAVAAGAGIPLQFNVRKAVLTGASVSYKDQGTGDSAEVTDLEVKVKNFALSGPFSADVSLKVSGKQGGKPFAAGLAYSGTADLGGAVPEKASVEFKKASVDYLGLRLEASGSAKGLKTPAVKVAFSLSKDGELLSGEFDGVVDVAAQTAKGDFKIKTKGFKGEALKEFGVPDMAVVPPGTAWGKVDQGDDPAVAAGVGVEST
jgi:uncharacterized protein involved in outer membrane biogenesis